MSNVRAPEVLRLKIKETAQNYGMFDNKIPSRTYCAIIIQAMATLLDMSITDLTKRIEETHQ